RLAALIEAGLRSLHLLLLLFNGLGLHPTQKKSAWTACAVNATVHLVESHRHLTVVRRARRVPGSPVQLEPEHSPLTRPSINPANSDSCTSPVTFPPLGGDRGRYQAIEPR